MNEPISSEAMEVLCEDFDYDFDRKLEGLDLDQAIEFAEEAQSTVKGRLDGLRNDRRRRSEHGGLPILDLVAATFVAVVVVLCFGWSHTPAPSSSHAVTLTAATPTIAIPQAAPVPVPVASIPPAPAPGAIGTALTVTKAPGGPDVVYEPDAAPVADTMAGDAGGPQAYVRTPPPADWHMMQCEVYDDSLSVAVAGQNAGWYPVRLGSDAVAADPAQFRNCTDLVGQ